MQDNLPDYAYERDLYKEYYDAENDYHRIARVNPYSEGEYIARDRFQKADKEIRRYRKKISE